VYQEEEVEGGFGCRRKHLYSLGQGIDRVVRGPFCSGRVCQSLIVGRTAFAGVRTATPGPASAISFSARGGPVRGFSERPMVGAGGRKLPAAKSRSSDPTRAASENETSSVGRATAWFRCSGKKTES